MNRIANRLLSIADERILRNIPGKPTLRLRLLLLRMQGARIGTGVIIGCGTRILGADKIVLHDRVSVARDSVLDARGGLTLQFGVLIGFESIILTSTHNSSVHDIPIQDQGMYYRTTEIGRNSWLGARCIVLPGASIGDNAIIGSGSVVAKPLHSSGIFVGTPAKELRSRL